MRRDKQIDKAKGLVNKKTDRQLEKYELREIDSTTEYVHIRKKYLDTNRYKKIDKNFNKENVNKQLQMYKTEKR